MSNQGDIEIDKKGDIVELSGLTDYGNEGHLCHALRTGTQEKAWANMCHGLLKNFHAPAEDRTGDLSIYSRALYHIAIKAGLYRKAVQVYDISSLYPMTFSPSILNSSSNS